MHYSWDEPLPDDYLAEMAAYLANPDDPDRDHDQPRTFDARWRRPPAISIAELAGIRARHPKMAPKPSPPVKQARGARRAPRRAAAQPALAKAPAPEPPGPPPDRLDDGEEELTEEEKGFLDFLADCAIREVEEEMNALREAAQGDKMRVMRRRP